MTNHHQHDLTVARHVALIDDTHTFAPCIPLYFALSRFVKVQRIGCTGGFRRLLNSQKINGTVRV